MKFRVHYSYSVSGSVLVDAENWEDAEDKVFYGVRDPNEETGMINFHETEEEE